MHSEAGLNEEEKSEQDSPGQLAQQTGLAWVQVREVTLSEGCQVVAPFLSPIPSLAPHP